MTIDQHTALYGVVGYPIGHSLSPTMHNTGFSTMGLNAIYLAFQTKDIEGCVQGMRALNIRGMSVTLPHKSSVIPLLDEVEDMAERIGAVNTVVNEDGRLIGYNTDAVGALRALNERMELSGKRCLMIGAGGAARAIGFMLIEKGVELKVVNRSVERGKALAHSLACPFIRLSELQEQIADLLIQTTPLGMNPEKEECLVPEQILRKDMVVMDIIYNPLETALLSMARARGCVTINGLSMFIHQGAEQFRLWTGLEPPISAMTHAVEEALKKDRRDA
ncbi:MAG: shikimate dehydrogenase [Deltaproteobacteria bacterium]|nr:MAG: shikimate dehydrogenase [Deltaproteobacteria bacterium]